MKYVNVLHRFGMWLACIFGSLEEQGCCRHGFAFFFFILIIATICHSSAYGNSFQLIYLSVIDEAMLIQCCAMLHEQHNYIAIRSADLAENVSWV